MKERKDLLTLSTQIFNRRSELSNHQSINDNIFRVFEEPLKAATACVALLDTDAVPDSLLIILSFAYGQELTLEYSFAYKQN